MYKLLNTESSETVTLGLNKQRNLTTCSSIVALIVGRIHPSQLTSNTDSEMTHNSLLSILRQWHALKIKWVRPYFLTFLLSNFKEWLIMSCLWRLIIAQGIIINAWILIFFCFFVHLHYQQLKKKRKMLKDKTYYA